MIASLLILSVLPPLGGPCRGRGVGRRLSANQTSRPATATDGRGCERGRPDHRISRAALVARLRSHWWRRRYSFCVAQAASATATSGGFHKARYRGRARGAPAPHADI